MKITMIYNTVHAFATQRNAYQNYILNNNFKFYIFQFFMAVNFLSAVFGFAKISSFCQKEAKTTPFRIRNSVFMGLLQLMENQLAIFNYAFSFDASKFEIISRNENYAFNQNKYFCRNGNNQSLSFAEGVLWERGFAKNRSNLFSGLLHFIRNDGDGLFSRNDYGIKFIFGFGDNLNFGFLFNRKTKKNKFMSAF